MLLSGVMLKMGVYGILKWIIPISPEAFVYYTPLVITLSVIGIVYGSVLAIKQKNVKRLIAFSSMAHVGLICAGVFSGNLQGLQGAVIQMVNHGVDVVGVFFIVEIIYSRLQSHKIESLGGLINKAPVLSIFFIIILLGNVALPLTNSFIGEFLLLYGVFEYNTVLSIFAGLTIILGAVYMLRMYKNVMLGPISDVNDAQFTDMNWSEILALTPIIAVIFIMGIYPKPFLDISEPAVKQLVEIINSNI